jgi:hypothetical protein
MKDAASIPNEYNPNFEERRSKFTTAKSQPVSPVNVNLDNSDPSSADEPSVPMVVATGEVGNQSATDTE